MTFHRPVSQTILLFLIALTWSQVFLFANEITRGWKCQSTDDDSTSSIGHVVFPIIANLSHDCMKLQNRCCLVRLGRCVDARAYNLNIIFTQLLSVSILAEAFFLRHSQLLHSWYHETAGTFCMCMKHSGPQQSSMNHPNTSPC